MEHHKSCDVTITKTRFFRSKMSKRREHHVTKNSDNAASSSARAASSSISSPTVRHSMATSIDLPPTYLVTPEPSADEPLSAFIERLERALERGIRLVQLRAKTLAAPEYAQLAEQALACCRRHEARLLLNAPVEMVQAVQADGIHLTSTRLMASSSRPLAPGQLVSAACHDAAQILHANEIGADLLTVSPVLPTATHTTATPLGWPRFRELVTLTDIPVYALGGMSADTLAQARDAGAHGIAAIRSLWAYE
jgi:thiamine-phosphate diphosphorylase